MLAPNAPHLCENQINARISAKPNILHLPLALFEVIMVAGEANKGLWTKGISPGSPEYRWTNLSEKEKSIWGAGKIPGLDSADDNAGPKVWPSFFDHDIIEIAPNKIKAIRLLNLQEIRSAELPSVDFWGHGDVKFAQCSAVHGQLSGCNAGTSRLPPGGAIAQGQDSLVCDCRDDYVDSWSAHERLLRYQNEVYSLSQHHRCLRCSFSAVYHRYSMPCLLVLPFLLATLTHLAPPPTHTCGAGPHLLAPPVPY
jgi:hypothetical protein